MALVDNFHVLLLQREFEQRDDADLILAAFRLNRDNVMASSFVESDVQFVDFDLSDALYGRP